LKLPSFNSARHQFFTANAAPAPSSALLSLTSLNMSDSEDPIDIPDEGGDDLFGDEDDDALSEAEKVLSDKEVASDREDDDLDARRHDDDEEPREFREKLLLSVPLYRHRTPRSKDGGVRRKYRSC
jgi:hypothetical protein